MCICDGIYYYTEQIYNQMTIKLCYQILHQLIWWVFICWNSWLTISLYILVIKYIQILWYLIIPILLSLTHWRALHNLVAEANRLYIFRPLLILNLWLVFFNLNFSASVVVSGSASYIQTRPLPFAEKSRLERKKKQRSP